MYVVYFDRCEKPSGDSSAEWKAWGIPSLFVALVRPWRLHGRFRLAVCMTVEIFVQIEYPQPVRSQRMLARVQLCCG